MDEEDCRPHPDTALEYLCVKSILGRAGWRSDAVVGVVLAFLKLEG